MTLDRMKNRLLMNIYELIKAAALFDVLPFLCRLIGITLLACAGWTLGLPPPPEVPVAVWAEGAAACFFLLLPTAQKISLGKLLTFEREVEQIKEETKDARETMASMLSIYGTLISTISNTVKQTVNVNFNPGLEERIKAQAAIEEVEKQEEGEKQEEVEKQQEEVTEKINEIEQFVTGSGGDYNFALARIRMEMERALREGLGFRTSTPESGGMRQVFLSAQGLFDKFVEKHPRLASLSGPFRYVMKACNAAIHGQIVEESLAREAIQMGLTITKQINDA